MNALLEVPEVVAESTHSRIDWTEPDANPNVSDGAKHTIVVLRDTEGKFVALEDAELPDVATPVTLVQHMSSADLRRKCIVWARWDGVKEAGFWDSTPNRMPLYRAEGTGQPREVAAEPKRTRKAPSKPAAKGGAKRAPRKPSAKPSTDTEPNH